MKTDQRCPTSLSKVTCWWANCLGGGGVSESTDRQGCPISLSKWYPKVYFLHKNPSQKFILQDFMLAILARRTMHHN